MSGAEQLQSWDGAYRWGGELGPNELRFDAASPLNFATAGSIEAPAELLGLLAGLSGRRISRKDALCAMAVLRARNLISSTCGTLPLDLRDRERNMDDRNWVGIQPHPRMERSVMMTLTFEDMFFEGLSYWRVTRKGSDGFPIEAEHVDIRAVSQHAILGRPSQVISEDHQFSVDDPIFIDGIPMAPDEVIRFLSPNPPFLVYAARAIRTVLLLDRVAAQYAEDPLPFGYFTDAEGMQEEDQMDDPEIAVVLDQWEAARKKRRWGYVAAGLKLEQLEWPSPEQLQLVQARNHAVLDIARGAGLDPEDVGVNIQGSSRTYTNAEQRRADLIDLVLANYLTAVEDRLSLPDVTPRGLFAHFDIHAFQRADFKTRMEGYKIGNEAGVFLPNDSRRMEGMPDLTAEETEEIYRLPTRQQVSNMPSMNGNGQNGNGRESEGVNQ